MPAMRYKSLILLLFTALLSGCEVEAPYAGDQGSSGSAHSLVISPHYGDALVDNENGTYRVRASVSVRNKDGQPVADGLRVELRVIDSIIAKGSITATDSITADVFADADPLLADNSATTFDTARITRYGVQGGETTRQIQDNDLLLLIDSDSRDKLRKVVGSSIQSTSFLVHGDYYVSYPNTNHSPSYVIGASMLGAAVVGEDEEGNLLEGYSLTRDNQGVAIFWLVYPTSAIYTGCVAPSMDDRVSPVGSADVYVTASIGQLTAVSDELCFAAQGPLSLSLAPSSIVLAAGGSTQVSLALSDAGNVPLPYTGLTTSITGDVASSLSISAGGSGVSDTDGSLSYTISADGAAVAGTATVEFYLGDNSVTLDVEIQ